MQVDIPTNIGSLPNEILINILSLFPTRSLLTLTTTSHRIHDLILRILQYRLLAASSAKDHRIILECYHPSSKFQTPYYNCEYLGTDALADNFYEGRETSRLAQLRGLYSHFRPIQPEGDRQVWTAHPAGGWLSQTLSSFSGEKSGLVSQNVDLESYELFSQLQSVVNLVKVCPSKGFFKSCTRVGEGLTRVWRDWLGQRAKNLRGRNEESGEQEKRLLWSSVKEDIGLRVRVIERDDVPVPVLRGRDEDPNVGYTLQIEELVVRTSQLLLIYEESLAKEQNHEGEMCDLDGVFISEIYKGKHIEESTEAVWRPMVEAF